MTNDICGVPPDSDTDRRARVQPNSSCKLVAAGRTASPSSDGDAFRGRVIQPGGPFNRGEDRALALDLVGDGSGGKVHVHRRATGPDVVVDFRGQITGLAE